MSPLRRGSFDDLAASRPLSRGVGALVRLGPLVIGRATFEPGWRWSIDVKPIVGTAWCQSHHMHVLLIGRIGVEMEDGERAEFSAGDVFELPPGHDVWVVGSEPATLLDVAGNAGDYGVPSSTQRLVATMLMTDIVGSTATAAASATLPGVRCSRVTTASYEGSWVASVGGKSTRRVTGSWRCSLVLLRHRNAASPSAMG